MKAFLASTSKIYGLPYLAYLEQPLKTFFKPVDEILFIPYARPSGITHDEYTEKAQEGLAYLNKSVVGIHQKENPVKALQNAQAVFTGGGNTFLLVTQLYKLGLMEPLRKAIQSGARYLGTSAGTNICGLNMQTTNDMPIIYPPSFKTLGIVPFNINAHYIDPNPNSKHQGETRETRIREFQNLQKINVVGLREGSWLSMEDHDIILEGHLNAKIFEPEKEAYEIAPGESLKSL